MKDLDKVKCETCRKMWQEFHQQRQKETDMLLKELRAHVEGGLMTIEKRWSHRCGTARALMGAFSGREGSGLPKKLCERIVVERMDDWGHCFIERKGVRLIDVEVKIGEYNDPAFHQPQEACAPGNPVTTDGACLLHKYRITDRFSDMEIIHYDSPTRFNSWEKATATVKLCSSLDDPWGDIPLVKVLGAGWMVSDNWVKGLSTLYKYPDGEEIKAMQYLFAGRYDQCTICSSHQQYE